LTATFDYRKMPFMANRSKYLDPAYSVIMRFGGPDGRLSKAISAVAAITDRSPSRVYLWMRPEGKGGTGGFIPGEPQRQLLEYARKTETPLSPSDFFNEARAA
jgi:hypothetical protein